MTPRPSTLVEVALRSGTVLAAYAVAIAEFMDEFYLDDDDASRSDRLREMPRAEGISSEIAVLLGAVAEHLASRWKLQCPDWVDRQEFMGDGRPRFYPKSTRIRPMLIVESPPAFRRRMLFTVAEPLVRARFAGKSSTMPFLTVESTSVSDR
jgi:hypothetical protein